MQITGKALISPAIKNFNILLIEDNPGDARLIQESLRDAIEANGATFSLEYADQLSTGLKRLAEGAIDAILLDLSLPDSSGLETLSKIYSEAIGVPVLVLTGLDDETLGLEAVQLGAQDYMVKGQIDGRLLLRAIRYAIERKQSEERIQRQIERLAALRSIDLAITSSLDLRITLNVLLEQVTTQLRVDAADVLLLNEHTQMLEYSAVRGFKTNFSARSPIRVGEGHAGRAALERSIVSIPDITALDDFSRDMLVTGEFFKSYYAMPLIAKGRVKGVLEVFHSSSLDPDSEWLDFLEALAGQAAIAVDSAWLFDDLQRSNIELSLAYDTTLEGWSNALDLRDKETEGHTQRVTVVTMRLARAMGVSNAELVHIRRGALLHDIGKMGIPDSILLKPGPLTDEEWEIMRLHPVYAYDLLSPIDFLRSALDIPYCHHEKWDGTGYPRGLKGEQIPQAARIFAIVDVWDALRSDRPYRPAWAEEKVRDHIQALAGTHFEPRIVSVFLEMEMQTQDTQVVPQGSTRQMSRRSTGPLR